MNDKSKANVKSTKATTADAAVIESVTNSTVSKTLILENVKADNDYTEFVNHPKGYKGQVHDPDPLEFDEQGRLISEARMVGYCPAENARVKFNIGPWTFKSKYGPFHASADCELDGKWRVEGITIVEPGDELVAPDGTTYDFNAKAFDGMNYLYLGGSSRYEGE